MSFLTGFATGLAKSVDTQLKESIERTRDNIDMVSKWRLKKAEEREKERKSKDKELQTLIQDAAFVISGDQNNLDAQNIAAALYKQRGLSGFTSDIEFMRKQTETGGPGVRPLDFIKRANEDVPETKFKLSEIVRSLSDAESSFAPSDMIFPKGTIKGSGLISSLVPDFDVTATGGAQAKDQMQKIGFETTPTASSIAFTRYNFDREGMNYHSMDTNSKLNHLQDIIVNTSSTEDEVKKAEKRRDALLNLAIEQGDDKTALTAIDQSLSQMNPLNADGSANTEYSNLITDRKRISRKITLQEAQLEGGSAVLRAQAVIAAADGDVTTATRLNREADDMDAGGFTPLEIQIARMDEDIQRNLAKHGDAYKNSDGAFAGKGMAEDIAGRNRLKTEQANLKGTTQESVNAAYNQIYATAKKNLARNNPKLEAALEALSTTDLGNSTQFSKILKLLEDSGVDAVKEFNKAVEEAIKVSMDQAVAEGWNTKSITLAGQRFQGLDLSSISASATAGQDQTNAALGTGSTDEAGVASDVKQTSVSDGTAGSVAGVPGTDTTTVEAETKSLQNSVPQDVILDMQVDFPENDPAKFVQQSQFAGDNNNRIASTARLLYPNNPEYINTVDKLLSVEASTTTSTALADVGYVAGGNLQAGQRDTVKKSLMSSLQVDDAGADYLINSALLRVQEGDSARRINQVSDVRSYLERTNALGMFSGQVPGYQMDRVVSDVAKRFKVDNETARSLVMSATTAPDDGISAFDVETIGMPTDTKPTVDVKEDLPDVDLATLSVEELSERISNDNATDTQVTAASQELIKRSKVESDVEATDRDNATVDLATRVKPDLIFRGMGTRIPYKKIGNDYYRIKSDGTLASSPANKVRKSMLENPNRRDRKQVGGVEDVSGKAPATDSTSDSGFSIEDAAEAQFKNRPDLFTGKETPNPSKPKQKSLMSDDPARNIATTSSDRTMQTQDMNLSDVKAMSDVALIARYVSGKMTSDMVDEFKRRLSNASFIDQATAIINQVNKAKKPKAKARGGLMRR